MAQGAQRGHSPGGGTPLLPPGGEEGDAPKICLRDLRHTHDTPALQAGVHPKVVSEPIEHASASVTLDTCSRAIPAMREEAAALNAELVFAAAALPPPRGIEGRLDLRVAAS